VLTDDPEARRAVIGQVFDYAALATGFGLTFRFMFAYNEAME